MAFFALIENNQVIKTIVVADADCGNLSFPASEPVGQAFIASLGIDGEWLQTCEHGSFRKQYAGSAHYFDRDANVFVLQQPPSGDWTLDDNFDWRYPQPSSDHQWNVELQQWLLVNEDDFLD